MEIKTREIMASSFPPSVPITSTTNINNGGSHHEEPTTAAVTTSADANLNTTAESQELPPQPSVTKSHLSCQLSDDFDVEVLHRGVCDAGRWAYGTVLVEVWVLNDTRTHLERPFGGWWLDPVFHRQVHDGVGNAHNCPLCRLTDHTLSDFVPPKPLVPGEGLPGVLWAEIDRPRTSRRDQFRRQKTPAAAAAAASSNTEQHHHYANVARSLVTQTAPTSTNSIVWRNVNAIVHDPDQPWNPRLQILAKAGLGWAAAVPFAIGDEQGMVVYLTRDTIDLSRLQNPVNETYLKRAALLIGAAYALRQPRQDSEQQRRRELEETWHRVMRKIKMTGKASLALRRSFGEGADVEQATAGIIPSAPEVTPAVDDTNTTFCSGKLQQVAHTATRKWLGGGVQPPPPFNWKQTAWTFVGVLLTLLMIAGTSEVLMGELKAAIVMGPFGALMTLLYGLTAAPASQPKNAIVGQTISIVIGILISYIPSMANYIKQSLSTALAVAAMVKLGVTHPPAGASCLLFATGTFGWKNLATMLVGNVMAILAATIINDLNFERQYPTYWGFEPILKLLRSVPSKVADEGSMTIKTV